MKKKVSILAIALLAASLCVAQASQNAPMQQPSAPVAQNQQPTTPAAGNMEVITPADVKWTSYAPGVQMAILSGDPNGSGLYTIRLKMADGNQIAAHWHPEDENVTVVSGNFQIGMGDKFDAAGLKSLPVGSHITMPKEMRHFAKATGETVIEIYGEGPFKINYVNPADDPMRAKQ